MLKFRKSWSSEQRWCSVCPYLLVPFWVVPQRAPRAPQSTPRAMPAHSSSPFTLVGRKSSEFAPAYLAVRLFVRRFQLFRDRRRE